MPFFDTISVQYQNQNYLWKCITKHMNFGPKYPKKVLAAISSFGYKAKMSQFAPKLFQTFINFPVDFHLLYNMKNIWNILFPFGNLS